MKRVWNLCMLPCRNFDRLKGLGFDTCMAWRGMWEEICSQMRLLVTTTGGRVILRIALKMNAIFPAHASVQLDNWLGGQLISLVCR